MACDPSAKFAVGNVHGRQGKAVLMLLWEVVK